VNTRLTAGLLLVLLATAAAPAQTPLGTAFTYQGHLQSAGVNLNATADLQLGLWDAAGTGSPPVGGTQIGTTQTVNNIQVVDGFFTLQVDFGANVFNGDARWLQIAVRSPAGSGTFTTLAPRQPVTATPYASLATAPWAINGANIYSTKIGNVGIGTLIPSQTLHLAQAAAPPLAIRMESGWGSPTSLTNFPTVAANIPDGGANWSFVSNVLIEDFNGARSNPSNFGGISAILEASAFNFAVPAGANIAGIRVEISKRNLGGTTMVDFEVSLIGGSGASANRASQAAWVVAAFTPQSYGGVGDLWNLAWTPAQINSSGFGVHLKVKNNSSGGTADVDYIKVQVFYTVPGSTNWTLGVNSNADFCLSSAADLSAGRLTISSTGNIGIGRTDPIFALDVRAFSGFGARLGMEGGGGGALVVGSNPNDNRVYLEGYNSTDNGSAAEMLVTGYQGGPLPQLTLSATNTTMDGSLIVTGTASKPGGGAWAVYSDRRFKNDIRPMEKTLDKLLALHGYTFTYNEQALTQQLGLPGPQIGLMADEVQTVFPDWVGEDSHGFKYITERGTTALLVEAIRTLHEENLQLRARLEALEKLVTETTLSRKEANHHE
jgi:hypothetical protein